MKTPEEIKLGLEKCRLEDSCENGCPYHHEGCGDEMRKDALAYIRALEAERDAAVRDFEAFAGSAFTDTPFPCRYCRYEMKDGRCQQKLEANRKEDKCYGGDRFKWRGVQEKEEETC